MLNPSHLVASLWIRVTTVGLFLGAGVSAFAAYQRTGGAGSRPLVWLTVVLGLLAFVGLVHSARSVFTKWMAFARFLHSITVPALFGACYLLVVPIFVLLNWRRDPLGLRPRSQSTFWTDRHRGTLDKNSLSRMG